MVRSKGETLARDFQSIQQGLDRTDVLMTLQDALLPENCVYNDACRAYINGGLDSGIYSLPINSFLAQSEDLFNGADFVFPNVFVPAFLPSF